MIGLFSIMAVGFFLGMRHATDPDHVIAVSTIVSRQPKLSRAAVIGILMSIFERRRLCTIRLVRAWAKWGIKCVGLLPQLCWFHVGLGGSYLPAVNAAGCSSGRAEQAFRVSNCLHAGLTSTV